jgi:glycine/D-amino acid oxidase-like deaminating enzyme
MDKKWVIVGHGLVGCALALTCYRRNISFRLVGYPQPGEASLASSGLIAPITGRRYVKAWRIDEYVSKALDFYRWSEELLGNGYFFPVEIIRFLSSQEARRAWDKRLEDPEYDAYVSNKQYQFLDEMNRPYGILTGGYRLDTPGWVTAARRFLIDEGLLEILSQPFEAKFPTEEILVFTTGALDPNVSKGIIPNKGESLILRMPEWKIPMIIKEDVFIVPLNVDHLFWVGSHYEPWPENALPTDEAKRRILEAIGKIYNGKVEVISHMVGIRPTVDDRRPLIGAYPGRPGQFIFNGVGTKGTSLAPFWSDQLIEHILKGMPLPVDVFPGRYIH